MKGILNGCLHSEETMQIGQVKRFGHQILPWTRSNEQSQDLEYYYVCIWCIWWMGMFRRSAYIWMRSFTSSDGTYGWEFLHPVREVFSSRWNPAITSGRIVTPLTQILLRTQSRLFAELQNWFSEFILHKHKPTQYFAEFRELLTKQKERGSEFAELRIYSQNFILSQTQTQHLQNLQNWPWTKKKVQNLQNSEFVSQNSYTSQTNPTFAEFAELLTKQKRFWIFAERRNFSEFNSSQTKPKFSELLSKKWFGICTTQNL
jgi:hypothetical protein